MSNPTECFHIKWFWMGNSEQMGDVKHCWTPLVFIVSGMVVSRHDQRLDGMCALGLCQWFCLRVGSDLSRRHLGRTSVFSLIWMISTHRSLFFSRVTLRVSKARASMKFMRGMADMRKIWHDTSYLSAYNSEFMWIWKLNHCCCLWIFEVPLEGEDSQHSTATIMNCFVVLMLSSQGMVCLFHAAIATHPRSHHWYANTAAADETDDGPTGWSFKAFVVKGCWEDQWQTWADLESSLHNAYTAYPRTSSARRSILRCHRPSPRLLQLGGTQDAHRCWFHVFSLFDYLMLDLVANSE